MNQAQLTIIDKNIEHQLALLRFSAGERKEVFKLLTQLQIELKNKLNNELTDFNKRRVEKLLKESTDIINLAYQEMIPISPPDEMFGYRVNYINKSPKDYYGKHFPDSRTIEIYTKGRTAEQIKDTLDHEFGHVVDYKRRGIVSDPMGDSIMGYDGKLRPMYDSDRYFRDFREKEATAIRAVFPKTHTLSKTQKEIYADAYKIYINDPAKLKIIAPTIFKEIDDFAIKTNISKSNLNLFELSQVEASFTTSMLGAISLEASLPTATVFKSLTSGVLIHGSPLSEWWEGQSASLARSFTSQVRLGIISNETQQQIITRVFGSKRKGLPGIGFPEETLRRNVSTLVHDTVMKVANDAKLAVYKENEDLFKGYYQLSTLDSHTTNKCIAYSGAQWDMDYQPIGDKALPFDGGTPRHPNCRSLILPLLKTYKELGYDIKEPPKGTRSSDLGQIGADTTFDGFLKRHSTEYQNDMLGKGRAQLWRDGKITLKDLVDGNGRELSLKELKDLI
jgi:hypothetical protein